MTVNINDRVWVTRDNRSYKLSEMPRVHVQNSLQWCMRQPKTLTEMTRSGYMVEIDLMKDGYTYDEWILAFTVRLLDPNCK